MLIWTMLKSCWLGCWGGGVGVVGGGEGGRGGGGDGLRRGRWVGGGCWGLVGLWV